MIQACVTVRSLLRHFVPWACCFAWAKAGNSSAAKIAMIAMTTSNSINVNASRGGEFFRFLSIRNGNIKWYLRCIIGGKLKNASGFCTFFYFKRRLTQNNEYEGNALRRGWSLRWKIQKCRAIVSRICFIESPKFLYPATLPRPSRWSLSSFRSASTISLTRSAKLVFGAQPSFFFALAKSPMSKSTSAGR